MLGFRSVLWIGGSEDFDGELVADAPSADFTWARDADDALGLPLDGFDAIVLDATDAAEAAAGLRRLRLEHASPPILVRLGTVDTQTCQSLRAVGAQDVVARGARSAGETASEQLLRHLSELVRAPGSGRSERGRGGVAEPGAARSPTPSIVGASPAMRSVLALVQRAMRSQATVLLSGETGTGKEVLARAVHHGGPRRARAFVAVNCAAFPDSLLESELFGHLKGSFTGADREKKGLFDAAEGGTLFLDEIGETSPALQAKLLRVLQERELRPVGGTRSRRIDVRLIAATNRALRGEVAAGRFREDLYYRLAVFPIRVPPLRERPEDVLPLAQHFLASHARREGRPLSALSPDAVSLLQAYAWPGNVRELENEMQRALALGEPGEALVPAHLSERLAADTAQVDREARDGETLRETMGRMEAFVIRRALDARGGRRAATARDLGITREGLYKKMQRFHIT
jgi:Nif-specific regulatory protein